MKVPGLDNDDTILYRLKHTPYKEAPYAQLFRKYYKYFCRIAYRVVGDEYACEDIVQNMFIEFYEHRLYETVEVSIAACMEILLKNRCYDHLKSRSRNQDKIKNFQSFKNSVEVPIFDEQFQQRERIEQAIQRMPPQQKRSFELVYKDGAGYDEAAQKLNISTNSLKTHLKLAIRRLRSSLKDLT